jgi:hypothetical protein
MTLEEFDARQIFFVVCSLFFITTANISLLRKTTWKKKTAEHTMYGNQRP